MNGRRSLPDFIEPWVGELLTDAWSAVQTLRSDGVTKAAAIAAQDEEIERLTAERDELRLTLLAELGDVAGAPTGWARSGGSWWRASPDYQAEVRRANIHPDGEPYHWTLYTPTLTAEGYAPTAREAMLAADRAWQEKA